MALPGLEMVFSLTVSGGPRTGRLRCICGCAPTAEDAAPAVYAESRWYIERVSHRRRLIRVVRPSRGMTASPSRRSSAQVGGASYTASIRSGRILTDGETFVDPIVVNTEKWDSRS